MSKRRKTKQEKKFADLNRKLHIHMQQIPLSSQDNVSLYKSVLEKHISPTGMKPVRTSTEVLSSTFIRTDLTKTFILTFTIIAGQILLFFLLKQHIIEFPFVSY